MKFVMIKPWKKLRSQPVGDFRIFYDVSRWDQRVTVRRVRRKGRSRSEEIW